MQPSDWNERYRTGDTPWDRGTPSPPLEDYLKKHSLSGRGLVPGCGSGHDVRLLARRGLDVTGLDFAPLALERARALPPIGRESYLLANLFELPPDLTSRFDWVWEHTCFCAIHPSNRDHYARAIAKVLKPFGRLIGVFYIDPDAKPDEGPPFKTRVEDVPHYFETEFELESQWKPPRCYPGREECEMLMVFRKK
jgi:SAM-dependent methyltransferase